MYVANTSYYTTPWVVPWMHTQLGSAGSAALGTAAGLKVLMRKGKIKDEPINVIAFCGDGGGADMGLAAISAALTHADYNFLIILYDNESYANTDIQLSGSTPYGADDHVQPAGQEEAHHAHALEEEHRRACWPRAIPTCRYIATVCASYARRLHEQGPQGARHRRPDVHPHARSVPEGLGLRPAASRTSWASWRSRPASGRSRRWRTASLKLNGTTTATSPTGRLKRKPVREYLLKQGRFAHFTEEDIAYFQSKVDESGRSGSSPASFRSRSSSRRIARQRERVEVTGGSTRPPRTSLSRAARRGPVRTESVLRRDNALEGACHDFESGGAHSV